VVGLLVGLLVGARVVGLLVGLLVGARVVGLLVGLLVGARVVGLLVGLLVGFLVGGLLQPCRERRVSSIQPKCSTVPHFLTAALKLYVPKFLHSLLARALTCARVSSAGWFLFTQVPFAPLRALEFFTTILTLKWRSPTLLLHDFCQLTSTPPNFCLLFKFPVVLQFFWLTEMV